MDRKSSYLFPIVVLVAMLAINLAGTPAIGMEGTFTVGIGPIQSSWAGAGVAAPRDGTWTALNPAGIVDLHQRIDMSVSAIFTGVTMHPRGIGANPFHSRSHDEDLYGTGTTDFVLPLAHGTLSIAMWTPSGVGVTYPHARNLFSALLGDRDRRLTYEHMRLGAAYAYKFENGWALGFEAHASLSRFRTDHLTLRLTSASADYDYDEALGGGFGLGIYKKLGKLGFGASFHSREWVDRFDEYTDLLKSSVDLPQYAQAGLSYDIAPWLTVLTDYKWFNWDGVPQHGGEPIGHMAGLLSLNPVAGGFGRNDQHIVKLASESVLSKNWTLRAGYSRCLTEVIPNNQVFLNALVPTVTRDNTGIGATYQLNDHWAFDLSWLRGWDREKTENGRGDLLSKLGKRSRIEAGSDAIIFGCTYAF